MDEKDLALRDFVHAMATRKTKPDSRGTEILHLRNELRIARAEVEALRKDARRYRWLRNDCATFQFPPYIVGHDVNSVSSCEQLDAAIDAHLYADKGEG